MSVRREVVSLSQLLRRNENASSNRGTGRAPPLPLQTSRHKAKAPLSAGHNRNVGVRQTHSAPITERPSSSGYQPMSFTQCVRGANHAASSQSEFGMSSQTSSGLLAPSQEVYEAESEQLSSMTSMSQSSFSQTQSQNLLGSSQDDQLHCLQQWQAQQVPPPTPPAAFHCNGSEKLRELEQSLIKAFAEQTRQQQELIARLASPIKKSVEEIKAKLATSSEDQQQQRLAIGELEKRIGNMAESVTELRQQSLSSKAASEETRATVANEAEAVKAALAELHARVETVEGNVNSCSGLVSRVLEAEATKHEALLSAVAASSCTCPKEAEPAEDSLDAERSRKRRRSPHLLDPAEANPAGYTLSSSPNGPLSHMTRARPSPRYAVGSRAWHGSEDDEADDGGLHLVLRRIERLRAKRRSYQHDL
ncbi:hypothetical protein PHYPSEUDO_007690 [Phytophthora pseudosyringae]|uniref:Uncharacterized protein n=1 Tax=Phytophthora pseudosyringae TaxID=221518 RepID=A0A8T1VG48_9STRA|nr:hypothetical protein PHYPSEUDO_007690 [Phytophthora pseudosyringae]